MFANQVICAAFHFVLWIAPTEEIRVLAVDIILSLQIMNMS